VNTFLIKITRLGITLVLVVLAIIALAKIWTFYTESPWTRDAKFSAEVVAIAPDVSGLISDVPVIDNQEVKQGQILFVIDKQRYEQALAQAEADVSYYQALVAEKKREAGRRSHLGVSAISQEEIDQSSNSLQTVLQQLAKAISVRDSAKLDLERTTIYAPADGWVTNMNVHSGEFLNRGETVVALVKKNSFYVLGYMEETKLQGVKKGYRVEITPLGSNRILHGTVDSIAAAVHDSSSTADGKGLASIDSNLEWVRLAQRVPVKVTLDDADQQHPYPAGTTATMVVTGDKDIDRNKQSSLMRLMHRLREFG